MIEEAKDLRKGWAEYDDYGAMIGRPCPFGGVCDRKCHLYTRITEHGRKEEYACGISLIAESLVSIAKDIHDISENGVETFERNNLL